MIEWKKASVGLKLEKKVVEQKSSFELIALSFMSPEVGRRSRQQTRDRP